MKAFRRLQIWFYRTFRGHIPAGHLVLFNPPLGRSGVWPLDPRQDPSIGNIGISLGGWRLYRSPGFMEDGTIVLIDGKQYNLYTWDLEVLDESG